MFLPKQIFKFLGYAYSRVSLFLVLFVLFFTGVFSYTRVSTPSQVYAATSSNLNFQARLLNSAGNVVPDGYYNLEFKLYSASAVDGGETPIQGSCTTNPGAAVDEDCLWYETYYDSNGVTAGNDNRVRVVNGYFSVNLGSQISFPSTINWDQNIWLSMNVGGSTQTATPTFDGEMSPRVKLTSVPHAMAAGQLQKNQGTYTGTVDFATLTDNRKYILPDTSLATTASPGTICVFNGAVSNCPAATGSAFYIQNGTSTQLSANYNIQAADNGVAGTVGATIQGAAAGQTVDLFQLKNSAGTILTAFQADGKLVFGPSGSQDTNLYRSAADTLKTDDNLHVAANSLTAGYLRVGSLSAPFNTAAGDLTSTRLSVGNIAFNTGNVLRVDGTNTNTAGGAVAFSHFAQTIAPTSNSSSEFRALYFQNLANANTGVTMGTLNGGFFEGARIGPNQNGNIATVNGLNVYGIVTDTGSNAANSATTVKGAAFTGVSRFSGTSTTTATDVMAVDLQAIGDGATTATNAYGLRIQNSGTGNTITNQYGIDIQSQTRGATNNVGLRIAAPSGATNNYALQLSSTAGTAAGGITFGTDTNLYRSAANTLTTDGTLTASNIQAVSGSGDLVSLNGTGTNNSLLRFKDDGNETAAIYTANGADDLRVRAVDTVILNGGGGLGNHLTVNSSGNVGIGILSASSLLQLGSDAGTAASGISFGSTGDTSLYRNASNTLTTGGSLTAVGLLTGQAGLTVTGAAINLNASSNFATNINTGTSTGAIAIGNSATSGFTLESGTSTTSLFNGATAHTVQLATGAAAQSVTVGSTNTTSSTTIQGGVSGSINLGSVGSSTLASTTNIATTSDATGTQTVNIGSSAKAANMLTLSAGSTGGIQLNSSIVNSNASTLALFATPTTIDLGAAAATFNIGPGAATAASINLAGGSGATGCTVDGATGNLSCSGSISSANTSGTVGFWSRNNGTTTLQPATAGDAITTSGNISTSGTGTITSAGLLTGQAGLTASGGAITLNNAAGAFAANINAGTSTGAIAIGNSATSTFTLESGTGASAIQIGNGTTAHGIQIGSNATGDNDILLGGANAGSTLTLEAGTNASAIQIGNGATAHGIQIGSNATGDNDIILGGTNAGSTITMQAGTNASAIQIGNNAAATGIQIGNANADKDILIGNSQNSGSTINIEGGTAATGIQIGNSTAAHGIQIGSNATGDNDILIGGANAGSTLVLEGGAAASAIQIGNGATAHGIQIGTGAAVQTVVLGSTNTSSATTIQAGSGNLTLNTGGTVRATFDTTNNVYFGNGVTAATPNNFSINGTGSSTAGTAGATLSVVGGAGTSTGTGSVGGGLTLQGGVAGSGSTARAGGAVTIQGGAAGGTGTALGGAVSIQGGNSVGTTTGSAVSITGGTAIGTNQNGGNIALQGGTPTGSGNYGSIGLQATGGNVGIGTASPSRKLHVSVSNTTTNALPLLIEQTSTGDTGIELKNSGQSFYVGIDSSDSNKFKISSSTASGSQSIMGNNVTTGSPDSGADDTISLLKTVAPATGTLTSVQAYVSTTGVGGTSAQVAIYAHDSGDGLPTGNPLAISNEITLTNGTAWNIFTFSGLPVNAGTTYWIGYTTNGDNNMYYNSGALGVACWTGNAYASGSFPNADTAGCNNSTADYDVYAVINGGGGPNDFVASLLQMTSTGASTFQNSVNSQTAFQVLNAAGTTNVLQVDTSNSRVGIGLAAGSVSTADLSFGTIAAGSSRTINVLTQTTTNTAGGNLTVNSAQGNGSGAGGQLLLQAGTGGTTGNGGIVTLQGGTGGSSGNRNGGDVTVAGGTATNVGTGGALTLQGGSSSATAGSASGALTLKTQNGVNGSGAQAGGAAGTLNITGGNGGSGTGSNSTGSGGSTIAIQAGTGGNATGSGTNGNGGNVTIQAGANGTGGSTGTPTAGSITLTGGSSAGAVAGGTVTLQGGAASATAGSNGGAISLIGTNGSATGTGGAGGNLTLTAGNAGGSGANNGGNVVLQAGSATSTGTVGGVIVKATADSAQTFQVQNAAGATALSIDTTNTSSSLNLSVNGGAETSGTFATNWTAHGGAASPSRTTTAGQYASGTAGVSQATTATSHGVRNNLGAALATSTSYVVSFSIKTGTASITNTNLIVEYYRTATGPTLDATCSTFSQVPTIGTSSFVKYTCTFTTSGTSGAATAFLAIRQADATSRTLFIDSLSIVAQNAAGTQNIGTLRVGGAASQGLTLLTLDTYAANPFTGTNASLAGSMYFDTTAGKIQCYDGSSWGACGAAPNSIVTLTPEYTGAVLNGTGVGTLNADFCANSAALTVGTLCGTNDARNFYKWTSPQATQQTYSVYVTYKLPSTFENFIDDNSITLTARTDNTTNGIVTYEVFKSTGSAITACGTATDVTTSGGANVWSTVAINGNENSTCSFTGGNNIVFKINVKAQNSATVYVENLNFTYTNQ